MVLKRSCSSESRADVLADIHHRKIGGRQGLRGKTRFARLQRQTAVVPIQRHQCRQASGAQNVLKFLGIGGDAEVVAALGTHSVDLDFQIGAKLVDRLFPQSGRWTGWAECGGVRRSAVTACSA